MKEAVTTVAKGTYLYAIVTGFQISRLNLVHKWRT
jgi:hypothetical protein